MTTKSSKEFSLRWNDFGNNLTSGFFSHLNENNLVDVTIAVEGQLLAAHKLVLSVCSPYFNNIFKENPCQHPVIILKDVKHTEVISLLKFMYQGEVNIKQDDLSTFLKVAQMLQIKGLEGGELNDYVNVWDPNDLKDVTAVSDVLSEQEDRSKVQDGSVNSHRIANKNAKTRKKQVAEDNCKSIKKLKNESNVDSKDDICILSDNDEKSHNTKDDSNCEKDIRYNKTNKVIHNSEKIIEVSNEQNLEGTSLLQSVVEPVIYRLSARGRPQLVHEGYVYNMTSRSKVYNSSHYRCAEQHRGCRGKCSVIAERFMPTGVHEHNHPPSYQSEYNYRKKKSL
ncbi:PREDICTED: protein abrupt-like [Cyphomyrmex costatus]|uniref:Protein tramtrack, alpha isoform n=1 Tax=Cyphomyrmex costatus TaxID=456900 RepID=A0A195BXZ4_9HYME|nr:PREDICTED: protein abrupt-like [Cyphomyrmex costatus]KYM93529.1 Protein tramtrack, alpha isoform [Cyphomyrmex costatus]